MAKKRIMQGIAVASLHPQTIRDHFLCRGWRRKTAFYTQSLDLPLYRRRGSWDRQTIAFSDHPTYLRLQQVHQHVYLLLSSQQRDLLADGDPVPEAPELAKHMPNPISEGPLQRKLRLLEQMARQGYRQEMSLDYMGIAIARNGSPIKISEGNNRLAAAQLLGLTRVEAEVRYVHESWFRAQVKSRGESGPAGIRKALVGLDSLHEVREPSE